MEIRRVQEIAGAQLSTDRKAMLLRCRSADGEFGLEVTPDNIVMLLRGLLNLARAQAEAGLPTASPAMATPARSVLIPTEDFAVETQPGGSAWLLMPVGTVTLSMAIPSAKVASALATALSPKGPQAAS